MLLARGIHHSTIYFAQYCRDVISILFSPISCGLVVLMKTIVKIIIIRRHKIVIIYSSNVAWTLQPTGYKFYRKRSDAANDPLVINTKDSSRLRHHAEYHFRLLIHLSKQRQSFPSCLATAGGKSFNTAYKSLVVTSYLMPVVANTFPTWATGEKVGYAVRTREATVALFYCSFVWRLHNFLPVFYSEVPLSQAASVIL